MGAASSGPQSAQSTLSLLHCSSSNCIASSQISVASTFPKRGLENKVFPFVSIIFPFVGILETPELIALGDSRCPMGMLGQNKGLFFFFFSFIFISWGLITSQHCSGFCHTLT